MFLWIKKLYKPKWFVSYDCEECCNHYCGCCGRGVQEGNWFYTKRAAIAAAHEWLGQIVENDSTPHEFIVTEIEGHTTIAVEYEYEGKKHGSSMFASIDARRYW